MRWGRLVLRWMRRAVGLILLPLVPCGLTSGMPARAFPNAREPTRGRNRGLSLSWNDLVLGKRRSQSRERPRERRGADGVRAGPDGLTAVSGEGVGAACRQACDRTGDRPGY